MLLKLKALLLIWLGLAGLYLGVQEWRLSRSARATPEHLTCEQLGDHGPGDNAHVIMSDLMLCDSAYVYRPEREGSPLWAEAWIPAVPRGSAYCQEIARLKQADRKRRTFPPPDDFRVLVKLTSTGAALDLSAPTLNEFTRRETLEGLVVNKIEKLDDEERKLLADSYPHVDLKRCWILEVGRQNDTSWRAPFFGGGGAVAIVVGVVLWRLSQRRPRTALAPIPALGAPPDRDASSRATW